MAYFFIILFSLHILEAITGFGSTSIGIPILALVLGTEASVALMSTAGLFLCLIIFSTQYKKVCVRELLIILACVFPVLPVGYLLYAKLRLLEWAMRLFMGSVVCFVAGRELWRRIIKKDDRDPPRWLVFFALGIGALVQGMFSMGGALINVFALTRIKDKSAFRATMVSVWLITNIISLFFRIFVLKIFTTAIWTSLLYALPLVLIAYLIGNRLHDRIADDRFVNLVYLVELASGLISIAGGLTLLL